MLTKADRDEVKLLVRGEIAKVSREQAEKIRRTMQLLHKNRG